MAPCNNPPESPHIGDRLVRWVNLKINYFSDKYQPARRVGAANEKD